MKRLTTLFLALSAALSLRAQTWTAQTSGTLRSINSVYAISGNTAIAVGQSGGGWRTTDGGQTWNTVSTNTTSTLNAVQFLDSLNGFACGNTLEIRRTTNGGTSWSGFGAATGQSDLFDVAFTAPNVGWMVGEVRNGYGFFYNPINNNTRQLTAAQNRNLKAICFVNDNNGWAVGDNGLVLKFANSGVLWSQQNTGANQTLNDVAFMSTSKGLAVGDRGTIIRTSNGGSQWLNSTSPTTQALNGVYYANDTLAIAVGNGGTILRTTNGGQSWTRETSGTTENLLSVHGAGPDHIWAVGDRGTILKRSFVTALKPRLAELFILSPNPATDRLTVEAGSPILRYAVYNILGEKLQEQKPRTQSVQMDLAGLAPGLYMLEVQTPAGSQVCRFKKI